MTAKKAIDIKTRKYVKRSKKAPVAFAASLSIYGGKSLTVDAEGEANLRLAIPSSQVHYITERWADLMDRSFTVIIKL